MGFVTISANLYVRFHYAASMPRSPQPESGRVYPIPAQYGGTVYINKVELDRRSFVEDVLTSIFGISMALYFCMGMSIGWWKASPPHDTSQSSSRPKF